ncbi:hypothetical protein PI95_004725 [Hassallia byssoidea VB512170]|uniref:Uncharacterized protein n=1 Tax=Hassallia byssoidea VB512170 TaxID=1304833 RepID=A0A846H3W0_9CYAN|nr:hypothetical protein [Hassalia byssoidea]NEU71895.1 hypothetical protein [Hassalia byssoidea VB512170]
MTISYNCYRKATTHKKVRLKEKTRRQGDKGDKGDSLETRRIILSPPSHASRLNGGNLRTALAPQPHFVGTPKPPIPLSPPLPPSPPLPTPHSPLPISPKSNESCSHYRLWCCWGGDRL